MLKFCNGKLLSNNCQLGSHEENRNRIQSFFSHHNKYRFTAVLEFIRWFHCYHVNPCTCMIALMIHGTSPQTEGTHEKLYIVHLFFYLCFLAVKLPNTESIPSYEIPTTPRGYCIIIDNAENNTFGGDEENEKLTRCLEESLAFHVEHFTRLNTKFIHRLLQHLSNVDHSSYSCLMVIVLGRGRNGFLYGHDNKLIEFHEIMSYFTPERCTTLEGKPKLFLFQTVNDGTESKEIKFHKELTDSYQVLSFICIAIQNTDHHNTRHIM